MEPETRLSNINSFNFNGSLVVEFVVDAADNSADVGNKLDLSTAVSVVIAASSCSREDAWRANRLSKSSSS